MYRDKTMIELHTLYMNTIQELDEYIYIKTLNTRYRTLKTRFNLLKSLLSNKECHFRNLLAKDDIYEISVFYFYEGYHCIDTSKSILHFISENWTHKEKTIFDSVKIKYIVG